MHYQVARNGQMYGPYTMEDLQRYLASGHILLTDLVKSHEMAEWIPVSQLLGAQSSAAGTPPTGYATVPSPYQQSVPGASTVPYPDPPNLHWALVLLLDIFTCSLFQMVWNIILAAWFRRVVPGSKALLLYIASAILLVLQFGMGQIIGITLGRHGPMHGFNYSYGYGAHPGTFGLYSLIALTCWVVRLIARFTFRSELEQHFNGPDPIGLRINPVLTFFFGGLYLQSEMNRINDIKQAMRYR